jgi:hypothetical protein
MEKTFEDDNLGKKSTPGLLRGVPTIRIDRLGLISRVKPSGFLLKLPLGIRQGRAIRFQRQRHTQHTILAHRGRQICLSPVQPHMFFVRQQVFR